MRKLKQAVEKFPTDWGNEITFLNTFKIDHVALLWYTPPQPTTQKTLAAISHLFKEEFENVNGKSVDLYNSRPDR